MSDFSNSRDPFRDLRTNPGNSPRNGAEFLNALKRVQSEGEFTKRTKEWVSKVESITEKDLKFIVQ